MGSRDYSSIALQMLTAHGAPFDGMTESEIPSEEINNLARALADSDLQRESARGRLRCADRHCPNHADTGDNMRFRGVQELHPQTIEEAASGAARRKKGSERYFCYACGKEALGTLDPTEDVEDALLPAPPSRPLKGEGNSPGSES